MSQSISAAKPPRVRVDGPTAFTLARKAEILGDQIIDKHGRPRLKRFRPGDAVDALAAMRARGIISEGEWYAGEKLKRARTMLFGRSVTPAPSFYRAMVADQITADALTGEAAKHEIMTEDRRQELLEEARDVYQAALGDPNTGRVGWLRHAGKSVEAAVRNLISTDWWPSAYREYAAIQHGLHILADRWRLEDNKEGGMKHLLPRALDEAPHILSMQCPCNPFMAYDPETGLMYVSHQHVKRDEPKEE
jgi:hypothetical protein